MEDSGKMKPEERLKIYMAMAEISRKWVSVMDTKAAFISALNAAVLGFIWTGAKVAEAGNLSRGLALGASVLSIISLWSALWTVFPRGSLKSIFGQNARYTTGFKAISFYGYVAEAYPKGHDGQFFQAVDGLDTQMLCREALEQHFTISHSVALKEKWVSRAGVVLIAALFMAATALAAKFSHDTEHLQSCSAPQPAAKMGP